MDRRISSMVWCVSFGILAFACASAPQVGHDSTAASRAHERNRSEVDTAEAVAPSDALDAPASTTTPEPQTDTSDSPAVMDTPSARAALQHKPTPIELMTRGGTAYLIDFANFGASDVANAACAEKAKKVEAAAWAELAEKAAKEAREKKSSLPTKAKGQAPVEDSEDPAKDDPKAAAARKEKARAEEQAEALASVEAQEALEAEIAEKAEAARAQCVKEAREKFEADVIRFRRDGLGHIQLVIYRRKGGSLKELYNANVDLDDSQAQKVKVVVKNGGGQRPIMKDRNKFEILMPNDYSLELQDPQLGRLSYTAKVGLVGN